MNERGKQPAFPYVDLPPKARGMTLREYYAGVALQGLLAKGTSCSNSSTPTEAVRLADMLLVELERL